MIGIVRRHEIMIRKQGGQMVKLTLERDQAMLKLEHVRVESVDLRARLA